MTMESVLGSAVGYFCSEGKGKVHSSTVHEGPEGELRYRCTPSLTSPLDGVGWSTPQPHSSFSSVALRPCSLTLASLFIGGGLLNWK